MTSDISAPAIPQLFEKPPRGRSLPGDAMRRLLHNRLAVLGLVIVSVMVGAAILAPFIAPYSPDEVDLSLYVTPPTQAHILGTDDVGRDILSRIIFGARVSLSVAIFSVAFGLVVGSLTGLVAGYVGGAWDSLIMRITDIFLAFPLLLLAIALVAALGPSEYSVFLALGIVTWPYVARLARGQVLSLKNYEYVTAARAIGVPSRSILIGHILPNMLTPLIVYATVGVASAILAESALAFLGLGAQPPTPSWGGMLSDTRAFLLAAPWLPTFPGIVICITALGFNLLGDGLRDALDVKSH